MTLVIIGAKGMLGSAICSLLSSEGKEFLPLDINEIDISSRTSVLNVLTPIKPDVIINCAAYTNVEKAEEEEELAFAVNHIGPKNLAGFASASGAVLCHISTDYVFDGKKAGPYSENDRTSPQCAYGRSKLAGEEEVKKIERHYIIRTAWLYGKNGRNFVTTILEAAAKKDSLKVVNDQHGSPTYAADLAKRILEITGRLPSGTYHATNSGEATWFDLAAEALRLKGIKTPLLPISSDEYPSKLVRPKNSVLGNDVCIKAGLAPMPHWKDALKRFLGELSSN